MPTFREAVLDAELFVSANSSTLESERHVPCARGLRPGVSIGFYTSTHKSAPERWPTLAASGKLIENSDIERMKRKFYQRSLLLLFFSGLLLTGCGQTSMQADKTSPARFAPWSDEKTEYTVGVGDEVEVKLPYNAEFSDRVTVGPDGRFTLPLIGEVRAEGRTVADLTAELDSRFSQDLRSPRVQVAIRNYVSQRIFVGGEVSKPGVYTLQGRIGLLEAIIMANANGSMDTGRMSQVVLIRRSKDGEPMMRTVDLTNFIRGSANDVPLQSSDVVFVPKSTIAELNQFMEQFVTRMIPFQRSFIYTIGKTQNYY
jgi:protein involved in polysaccharide export with SLBB domain